MPQRTLIQKCAGCRKLAKIVANNTRRLAAIEHHLAAPERVGKMLEEEVKKLGGRVESLCPWCVAFHEPGKCSAKGRKRE